MQCMRHALIGFVSMQKLYSPSKAIKHASWYRVLKGPELV